jgi:uncharacterized protein DUF1499
VQTSVEILLVAALLAVVLFVPALRRFVSRMAATILVFSGIAAAIFGVAVLMNNVSLYESPGPSARVRRFLSVNWAATSEKGLGSAECSQHVPGTHAAADKPRPAAAQRPAAIAMPTPTPEPGAPEQEDYYPELVRHGYPGIARAKLFELAKATVDGLGGWKVVNADARAGVLECVYTTRIFRFEDEVRIAILPNSEIDLCSRSRSGIPDASSWMHYFPGDFGANIGHIKEFYEALEPKVDAVYKEQEERQQNAGRPR